MDADEVITNHQIDKSTNLRISRPQDLPTGKIVGFFGLIDERVDQDLLITLARKLNQRTEERSPVDQLCHAEETTNNCSPLTVNE